MEGSNNQRNSQRKNFLSGEKYPNLRVEIIKMTGYIRAKFFFNLMISQCNETDSL